MKRKDLTSDLQQLALGVAHLHHLEKDEEKKKQLDQILKSILKMLESLDSEDHNDDDQDKDLLEQIWSEVVKNFVKYGLGELFDRLLDFGITTYRDQEAF